MEASTLRMVNLFKKVFYETEFKPKLALEQCVVRNFLHLLVVAITLVAQFFGGIGKLDSVVVTLGLSYIVLSMISTFLVYRHHNLAKVISIVGIMTDTFIICFIMYMGADKEASLYGLLLFLVIANGLRFGKSYMQFANIICLLGFVVVVSFNEFWKAHTLLSIGNVIWLILIPAHLTNLLTRLETTLLKAESANVAKTLFLANMSHEIRTPLTAIIGFSKTLLENKQSIEKRDNAISTIIRNGKHLSSIVNDILDISKIESGKMELEFREFSVVETIREVEVLFRKKIENKELQFIVNYNLPLPAVISSDSVRIKQILINLCSNAMKFTKQGSIEIDVFLDEKRDSLVISVKDSGLGLNEKQCEDVFSNFTQADISTTREYGGTGLGLPISAKLAEMLNGKLWVESELGEGSVFSFSIGIEEVTEASLIYELPEEILIEPQSLSSHKKVLGRILLVEDVVDKQVLISTLLEDMGAMVDIAENGQIALEKTSETVYDLVLLDLQMPIMGGKEALIKMRQRNDTFPVVFLTANVIQNEENKSKELDCQGFLSKPIDNEQLRKVVATYLKINESTLYTLNNNEPLDASDNGVIISSLISEHGGLDKYSDIANTFALQLNDRISAIESALETNDYEQFKELIHNLKGLGGNMGYLIVTDRCNELEFAVSDGDEHKVEILIRDLYDIESRILAGMIEIKSQKL